jgi:hypothetical protein
MKEVNEYSGYSINPATFTVIFIGFYYIFKFVISFFALDDILKVYLSIFCSSLLCLMSICYLIRKNRSKWAEWRFEVIKRVAIVCNEKGFRGRVSNDTLMALYEFIFNCNIFTFFDNWAVSKSWSERKSGRRFLKTIDSSGFLNNIIIYGCGETDELIIDFDDPKWLEIKEAALDYYHRLLASK